MSPLLWKFIRNVNFCVVYLWILNWIIKYDTIHFSDQVCPQRILIYYLFSELYVSYFSIQITVTATQYLLYNDIQTARWFCLPCVANIMGTNKFVYIHIYIEKLAVAHWRNVLCNKFTRLWNVKCEKILE